MQSKQPSGPWIKIFELDQGNSKTYKESALSKQKNLEILPEDGVTLMTVTLCDSLNMFFTYLETFFYAMDPAFIT